MKDTKNLLKVAKREKYFSTLAKKEGKGAASRAKREKGAAKQDSLWEKKIDKEFQLKREKIATAAKRDAMASRNKPTTRKQEKLAKTLKKMYK